MLDAIQTIERPAGDPAMVESFRENLSAAERVNWRLEDVIGGEKELDFSKPFMPESLARVEQLGFLNTEDKLVLNQIRGNAYLSIFVIVEEFILPFLLDHIRPTLNEDDYRVRAMLQFAGEEAKHIQLFRIFAEKFRQGFGTECSIIGPAEDIGREVLSHHPLAVALTILGIEWMTQRHYIESIKDNKNLDPLFKSLLKNHWLEEAQHAKLDALMVEALAEGMSEAEIESAVDEYLEIGNFVDTGIRQQAIFDLEALQTATGRQLSDDQRSAFIEVQHQANRWTYLGSGLTHPRFLDSLGKLSEKQRRRIESIAPMFC